MSSKMDFKRILDIFLPARLCHYKFHAIATFLVKEKKLYARNVVLTSVQRPYRWDDTV